MAYGLIRFQQTEKPLPLYMAGVALDLGLLAKYTMAFYAVGMLAGVLLVWERKRH